ncbi:MAG: dUTP diphosphatase [Vicinamibacterales bacterium]
MRLNIRRLDPTVALPSYGTGESAAFDLAAAHDATIAARSIALVRTGLVIEVPSGHVLAIFARSSTPLKRGLMVANGVGLVDPDYCGPTDEVMIQVLNVTDADVAVTRGDRLAQGIVLACPRVTWHEVQDIRTAARGGFGATGN